jgi:dihydroorotate dehydrogenase (NAD+) catalytic subunit
VASGILGVSKGSVERVARGGAGASTLKSLCHEERKGNPNPTMLGWDGVFLNAVGLPGQGIDAAAEDFKILDDCSIPIIGSVYGYTIEQFASVTAKMAALKPSMIELDISCPHMKGYAKPFSADPESITAITSSCKKAAGGIPISVKLSPNVHDIAAMAVAAEKAGADCITAINTATAMKIDLETRRPVLSNKVGGLSGPALKPIAVRCVYEIAKAVAIPIIGTGGVSTGEDAIEMIMAGATAVGVGTACWQRGPDVFGAIAAEMEAWMTSHGVTSLGEIRGAAHED